jgi:hypothetical protein
MHLPLTLITLLAACGATLATPINHLHATPSPDADRAAANETPAACAAYTCPTTGASGVPLDGMWAPDEGRVHCAYYEYVLLSSSPTRPPPASELFVGIGGR